MGDITFGNLLTILTIVIGLVIQYVAIVKSFGERIAVMETKQEENRKDIDNLFSLFRNAMSDIARFIYKTSQ